MAAPRPWGNHSRSGMMARKKSDNKSGIDTDDLPELPVEGEVREVEVDKSKVFAVAAAKMYKTNASALKELISNAFGAVLTAIREGQIKEEDALVSVTAKKGRIVVEDNGTGISLERLENSLIVMGKSGNTDGTKHGLMGVGFFGHTKLTDRIVVDTLTADGFGIRVECLKGWNWNELGKSTRKTPGTTIEFDADWLREDTSEIRDLLVSIGAVTKVKFVAEIDGIGSAPVPGGGKIGVTVRGNRATFEANRLDLVADAWRSDPAMTVVQRSEDGFDILFNVSPKNFASGDPVISVLGIPIKSVMSVASDESGEKKSEGLTLPFEGFVSVTNERKFKPKTNREELTEESARRLQEAVNEVVIDEVKAVHAIRNYDEFMASDKKPLYVWTLQYNNSMEDLYGLGLTEEVKDFMYPRVFKNNETIACCVIDFPEAFDFLPVVYDPKAKKSAKRTDKKTKETVAVIAPENGREAEALRCAKAWGMPIRG